MCRLTDNILQGAKASMKRERERNQNQTKSAKSQIKSVRINAFGLHVRLLTFKLIFRTRRPATFSARCADRPSSRPPRPPRTLSSVSRFLDPYRTNTTLHAGFGLNLTNERLPSSLLEHASNKHNKGLADCFPGTSA